jgi:hypothetical protein
MKIALKNGLVNFDLVDNTGRIYDSHQFETSGELESEIPLDVTIGSQSIRLIPKINRIDCQDFTIDGMRVGHP